MDVLDAAAAPHTAPLEAGFPGEQGTFLPFRPQKDMSCLQVPEKE